MKSRTIYVGILLSIIFVFISHAQQVDFRVLKGPYLGQEPPGLTPKIFAPGFVSTDVHEFAKTGERIANIRQIFTVREGSNPINFNYPKVLQGDPPPKDGPLKKVKVDIDTMKKEFYKEMDWDLETGMPSEKKMKELRLDKLSS